MDKRFYRFLQATCCNWRNSFFIDCQHCPNCSGFLLSVNHNAVPTGIEVLEAFQRHNADAIILINDHPRSSIRGAFR